MSATLIRRTDVVMRRVIGAGLALFACITIAPVHGSPACENDIAVLDADFEGAGMASCTPKRGKFIVTIAPENSPINPSPWYAFRVTPKRNGTVKIIVDYEGATHRYDPKQSVDGDHWQAIDPANVSERRKGKRFNLKLAMANVPIFIAGQELYTGEDYQHWAEQLLQSSSLKSRAIGQSVLDAPIVAFETILPSPQSIKEIVLLVGRQHPPEVTGGLAMRPFVETVFGQTCLAQAFRSRFQVIAVPLINPDGVDRGYWRHNINGIDLNRDWGPFTQPETQAIKNLIDAIAIDEKARLRLMLDFHSTNRNVFYTQTRTDQTVPANFANNWLSAARAREGVYEFEHAERAQSDQATSKNYIFARFRAPAITYEVGDQTDRADIDRSAIIFAEEMMRTLLGFRPAENISIDVPAC